MEDPDLVVDLRELNFNNNDMYSIFWKQYELVLQECTAVHECRHDSTTFLACALSVRDLIEQVAKKCSPGVPIPSLQWVRLQFYPKNSQAKTAGLYRKCLTIKMMVQKRQFHKNYIHEHYCAAIFRYLREYSLKYCSHSLLR